MAIRFPASPERDIEDENICRDISRNFVGARELRDQFLYSISILRDQLAYFEDRLIELRVEAGQRTDDRSLRDDIRQLERDRDDTNARLDEQLFNYDLNEADLVRLNADFESNGCDKWFRR
jgi:hypothetical protein